jgi:hypothetical protein
LASFSTESQILNACRVVFSFKHAYLEISYMGDHKKSTFYKNIILKLDIKIIAAMA